jgi:2-oxoglutarate dehydrogenase E2 component (dihydrolipoamide succinyltransferase)
MVPVKVPALGESIAEAQVGPWLNAVGDRIKRDEPLVEIESEKATVEIPAPADGVLARIVRATGETVAVGEVIGEIDTEAGVLAPEPKALVVSPPAPLAVGKDVAPPAVYERPQPPARPAAAAGERVERMSPLRRTIASRLVSAKQEMALLTTFNEVDMTEVNALRARHGEAFKAAHGVKLGMMSFFVRAVVEALRESPRIGAQIRGDEIVYRDACDVGIAIGGGKGLVVPVLRGAERLDFAEIERAIADFGARAKEGRIAAEELEGGTFTISNGGVYGSLMSTPIVNPPQSGVLGLHAVQDRPVARDGQVVIRPMMYVALTYDHRIVDGREAVTFLKSVKERVESPSRLLLGL